MKLCQKFLLIIFLLIAVEIWAVTKSSCEEKKLPTCCEKTNIENFSHYYHKEIGLSCPVNAYFFGEFLLFKTQEEGLEYGLINDSSTNAYRLPLFSGKVLGFSHNSHKWDWNFGARLGIGGYLSDEGWNIDLTWTYVDIKQTDSVAVPIGRSINPFFIPSSGLYTAYEGSAKWSGSVNCLDLCLGKPYLFTKRFLFNPFAGLRGLWIEQDFLTRYTLADATKHFHSYEKVFAKNDFLGIGIRAGAKCEFIFDCGLSIFCFLSGSLPYGKFEVSQSNPSGEGSEYHLENNYYIATANIEAHLGVNWAKKLCDDRCRFMLSMAYESHYFFNQLHLIRFTDDIGTIQGNHSISPNYLSLNGFSFKFQFDF